MDAGLSVDPDAVEAGVFWVAPVSQHPHLDDLESLVVFLLQSGDGGHVSHHRRV